VREPLGFRHLSYGVAESDLADVAREAFTGPTPTYPHASFLRRALGGDLPDLVRLTNDPRFLTGVVPGGNVIGTASEFGRFFELLLRGGTLDGARICEPQTIARAVEPQHPTEIDGTIKLPVRYGLGFMLGGPLVSFFGPTTPDAFGHLGFTNVLAWADPERDISVAFMNSGKPLLSPRLLLWLDVMRVIARRVPRVRARGSWLASLRYPRAHAVPDFADAAE
jgi:CubicO group peptidase (beta-lactamase class C family)